MGTRALAGMLEWQASDGLLTGFWPLEYGLLSWIMTQG